MRILTHTLNSLFVVILALSTIFIVPQAQAYPNPQPSYGFSYRDAQRITQVLYSAILWRYANANEVARGINLIQSQDVSGVSQLTRELAESYEYNSNIDNRYSSDQIVVHMFQVFFNRYPDAQKPWTISQMLDQGQAGDAWTAVVSQPEFRSTQLHRP